MIDPKYIFILLSFLLGLLLYIRKPSFLCIYWLSLQPIVMPLFVLLFVHNIDIESFDKLYFSYATGVNYLFVLLLILSLIRKRFPQSLFRSIIFPLALWSLFLIVQGLIIHFSLPAIYHASFSAFNIVCPLLLLILDERFRPKPAMLKKFIFFVICLQAFFCILNCFGITIYPLLNQDESFANHLISGTFGRYNHMTNYLTTLYLLISCDYYEGRGIKDFYFFFLTFVIGIIVLFSGARMSLVLFLFTLFVFFFIYKRHQVLKLLILFIIFFVGWRFLMSSEVISNKEADEGTGMERNIAGLSSFMQNDLDEDDSTVSLSIYLLAFYFNNPILGNGYSYMGEDAYVANSSINQSAFSADARIAYMLVEYGIAGVFVYILIFMGILRCLIRNCTVGNRRFFILAYVYFFICTLTEGGFFDLGIFPMLYIYGFQKLPKYSLNKIPVGERI